MATRSDELTAEIQSTRQRMDRTLDDIGERAGPGRLTERVGTAVGNARDTVMGGARETGGQVGDAGRSASGALRRTTDGNPLAAGLVAFGAGLLAGSLLPESRTEGKLAGEVQRKAQGPLRDQVQQSAGAIADQVGERAEEAKERVVGEARDAKDEIASDVSDRTDAVQDHARSAAEDVRDDVQDQAEQIRDQVKEEARHQAGQ